MKINELKHENLIAFKEYFETTQHLYLVMECAGGGELFDRITARKKYTEKDAQVVVLQMLRAVEAVHSLGIVHADIKPDNLYAMKHQSQLVNSKFWQISIC